MTTKPEMTIAEAFRSQSSKPGGIACYGGAEPVAYKIARTYRTIRLLKSSSLNALSHARRLVAKGNASYPIYGLSKFGAPFVNGGGIRGDKLRWIESPGDGGLREVWRADAGLVMWGPLATGEEFKGVVYLLTGRKGMSQMVAGYLDPNNDGPAAVCLDETFCGNADGSYMDSDGFQDAKHSAEEIARIACEADYAFQEQDAREQEVAELKQTIEDCRKERRTLMRSIRAMGDMPPAICAALRKQVYSIRRESSEAHKRLAGLGA